MQFTRSLILLSAGAALAAAASTGSPESIGCYTDLTSTTSTSDFFNSAGLCHTFCSSTTDYFAVQGINCLCLDTLPEDKTKVDDKKCAVECPGYPNELCGGEKEEYTVYSGSKKVVDALDVDASTTSSSSSAKASATETAEESASSTTASASATASAISSAAANSTSSNSTGTTQPPQGEDADSAAGRNVASLVAAVMVAAGLVML